MNRATKRTIELEATVLRLVADIDNKVSQQLSAVYDSPELSELQSVWEGLRWLVEGAPSSSGAFIKIIDISLPELLMNMRQSANLFQTVLYQKVYMESLCTLGGHPFGMLLACQAFEFFRENSSELNELTILLSELGEQSLCPLVVALGHDWMKDNTSLAFSPARLERLSDSIEYSDFHRIRQHKSAHFLAVTWPGLFLERKKTSVCERFVYQFENARQLCLHSGFALLAVVLREYGLYGWFSGLLSWGPDVEGGAILPYSEGCQPKAEYRLSESLESTFSELGVLPLSSTWLENRPGFFIMPMSGSSAQVEQQTLPALLIICRFAHYLKVMVRDRLGRHDTASECRDFLQAWLDGFCSRSEITDISYLADYPLKWAKIQMSEARHAPGEFLATVSLFPNLPPGLAKAELTVHLQLSTAQ